MHTGTIIHEAVREYAYPVSRERLLLKLKSSKGGSCIFFIHWCNRFHDSEFYRLKMECRRRDGEYDWFYAEISPGESIKYIRYYFELLTDDGILYYGTDGLESKKPRRCFEYLYTNEFDVFDVPEWAEGAVFYQVFPERFFNGDASNDPQETENWGGKPTRTNFFGGDLKGIISKLDHIAELGADCLYINPVFKSPSNHKYDTEDYYKIDPSFGDIGDLKELVSRFHNRGIRVVLDGVFNHCGYTFPPFQDVLKNGKGSKYAEWFYIDGYPLRTDPPNYECVGYYKWMPKIRLRNREVRDYFLNVGTYWIKEADIDGWRLDVADEVDFTFWQEFRHAIKAVKEDAILIGETWKDGRDLLRGDQMDSVMNYLFRDAVVDYFAERTINSRQFDNRIQRMLSIYPDMVYPVLYNLIGSHDTPRIFSLCGEDARSMKLAAAFQMTFPGMPAVYYGDEFAMVGENDPDCRRSMDWADGDGDMFEFYKQMTAIRRETTPLKKGSYHGILCEEGVYGYARRHEGDTVYIVFNNSDEEKQLSVPLFGSGPLQSLIGGKIYVPIGVEGTESFFNSDIQDYRAKFEMTLPARRFEIIKQGGI